MINVYVPATSANLGVGYDCLGLALDMKASATFEEIASGLEIIGCDARYCNEDNLFYQAFMQTLTYLNESITGLRICVSTDIPYARGLGSSATCIVAGIAGANAMMGNRLNKYEMFDLATRMEGHPDNVAPAIFGGLCVSFMEDDKPSMIRYGVKKGTHFVTIIPDYEVSTHAAREVLPDTMCYQDAIYQMGRCAAFAKALEIGNERIMKKACTDKMQEPYRKPLIPQFQTIQAICEEAGAATMFISGSGSTMIAITLDDVVADTVIERVSATYPTWDVRLLHATYDGVQCEEN